MLFVLVTQEHTPRLMKYTHHFIFLIFSYKVQSVFGPEVVTDVYQQCQRLATTAIRTPALADFTETP